MTYLRASLEDMGAHNTLHHNSECPGQSQSLLGSGERLVSADHAEHGQPSPRVDRCEHSIERKRRKVSDSDAGCGCDVCKGPGIMADNGESHQERTNVFMNAEFEGRHITRVRAVPSCDFVSTTSKQQKQQGKTGQNDMSSSALTSQDAHSETLHCRGITTADFVHCVTHPDVVDLISEKLRDKYSV